MTYGLVLCPMAKHCAALCCTALQYVQLWLGLARPGQAGPFSARPGQARPGSARLGSALLGQARRPGQARPGQAWPPGQARPGRPAGHVGQLHTALRLAVHMSRPAAQAVISGYRLPLLPFARVTIAFNAISDHWSPTMQKP